MRNANPEITSTIKAKTLELLLKKNPDEIGMRDIATNAGITAANIYHYYKDKNKLFQEISLDCLNQLNDKLTKAKERNLKPKSKIKAVINTFVDWCFENPRLSLLVMTGIKSANDLPPEAIEKFYICNRTGEGLLSEYVKQKIAVSKNPRLDVGVLVSGVWGCIESVLLKKSDIEYWENGKILTDRFIDLWIDSIFIKSISKNCDMKN